MEVDPKVPPYQTGDRTSFAYISARDRWPIILVGINDEHDPAKADEGKSVIEQLAKLKYELQHDRRLSPLPSDGISDIEDYNKELEALGNPTWFSVPWLYSECYLYRRLSTILHLSENWGTYDVFARQKLSTFKSSRPAVLELASRYKDLIRQLADSGSKAAPSTEDAESAEKLLFTEMAEICLWGNATDLSLLTSLTYDDIQKLQGSSARKAAEANIIANDLPAAYRILKTAQRSKSKQESRRVDIVLDNAGFELYVDLILTGYLLASNLATHVVLHPKKIPWFVSDVTPQDFTALINALGDPQRFFTRQSDDEKYAESQPPPLSDKEVQDLQFLRNHLGGFLGEGQISIRPNIFWTTASSFWRLPTQAPQLFADLQESELVIFKGDLNYRKLTADAAWDPTTPFAEAIGPMGKDSGMRTLALRTCKADVVVGLREGQDEELRGTEGGGGNGGQRKWAWSGKWAVVQVCDGKAETRR